jgi:hypothetical protein
MKNDNEITIKINLSDSLLTKVANIMLLSSSPAPLGVMMSQIPATKGAPEKEATPIGFKQ